MLRRLPALNALKENAAGNRAAEHLIARPAQRHEVQQQVGVVIEARGQAVQRVRGSPWPYSLQEGLRPGAAESHRATTQQVASPKQARP
jgi:hypothetical protein